MLAAFLLVFFAHPVMVVRLEEQSPPYSEDQGSNKWSVQWIVESTLVLPDTKITISLGWNGTLDFCINKAMS